MRLGLVVLAGLWAGARSDRPTRFDRGSSTLKEICSKLLLRRGDSGDCTKSVQRILAIDPNGVFGPDTEKEVKAFQAGRGLAVDGVVGPNTWAALHSPETFNAGSSDENRDHKKEELTANNAHEILRSMVCTTHNRSRDVNGTICLADKETFERSEKCWQSCFLRRCADGKAGEATFCPVCYDHCSAEAPPQIEKNICYANWRAAYYNKLEKDIALDEALKRALGPLNERLAGLEAGLKELGVLGEQMADLRQRAEDCDCQKFRTTHTRGFGAVVEEARREYNAMKDACGIRRADDWMEEGPDVNATDLS